MQEKAVLIIFLKNPVRGKVKTRLAETVGPDKALRIYHQLLAYTRDLANSLEVKKQVWYSEHAEERDGWDPATCTLKVQQGDDLGEKMKNAFVEAFREGCKPVVIIGSDCAELTEGLLIQAFDSLVHNDVVIGPSEDGGYYLLGMNAHHPDLFEDIPWSTPDVLSKTLIKVKQKGLDLCLLPELNDVDLESDWSKVRHRLNGFS